MPLLAIGTITVFLAAMAFSQSAWATTTPGSSTPAVLPGSFYGLACASTSTCFGVGSTGPSTFIAKWNGATWSGVPSPDPAGFAQNDLAAVSCPSTSFCVAIGSSSTWVNNSTLYKTLIEDWDGTSWSIVPSPDSPSVPNSVLSDVSCTSPSACTAVGYSDNWPALPGPIYQTLVENWNGTSWSITPSQNVTSDELWGVSCTSALFCMAVGDDAGSGTFAEDWNGSSWSIVPSADPPGPSTGSLRAVSCSSSSRCVAVGGTLTDAFTYQTLIEQWDGASWSVDPASGLGSELLQGVSCVTSSDCMAVGGPGGPTSPQGALAEQWEGSAWATVPSPSTIYSFAAVECADTSSCMAVGWAAMPGIYLGSAATWDGATWTAYSAPPTPPPPPPPPPGHQTTTTVVQVTTTTVDQAPITEATTVHTGEPWAGSDPVGFTTLCVGIGLVALGERSRRRTRRTTTMPKPPSSGHWSC